MTAKNYLIADPKQGNKSWLGFRVDLFCLNWKFLNLYEICVSFTYLVESSKSPLIYLLWANEVWHFHSNFLGDSKDTMYLQSLNSDPYFKVKKTCSSSITNDSKICTESKNQLLKTNGKKIVSVSQLVFYTFCA